MHYIKVKNNTQKFYKLPPENYSSWLEFWEDHNTEEARFCESRLCTNSAEIGAVVKREDNQGLYVVPLCINCKRSEDFSDFEVRLNKMLPIEKI